jgi:hypothetical protein
VRQTDTVILCHRKAADWRQYFYGFVYQFYYFETQLYQLGWCMLFDDIVVITDLCARIKVYNICCDCPTVLAESVLRQFLYKVCSPLLCL